MNKPSVDFALSFTYKIMKPSTDLANGTFADGQKKSNFINGYSLMILYKAGGFLLLLLSDGG